MHRNKGFSLIELMVVIAIIAVLAAMAIPSYRTHTVKSKIISVMPVLESFAAQLRAGYNKNGVFPPSYEINGVNLVATSAWTYVNYGKIYGAAYQIASDGKGAAMMFSLSGLQGIPNYVEPSQPNNYGMRTNIYYVIRDVDGILVTSCGTYNSGNTFDIPIEYLPAACKCINAGLNFVNGSAC